VTDQIHWMPDCHKLFEAGEWRWHCLVERNTFAIFKSMGDRAVLQTGDASAAR
jgi:hypothetical protein